MNKSFEIGSRSIHSNVLFMEIGESYCILSFLNGADSVLDAVEVYTFERFSAEQNLREIIDLIPADKSFEKVIVAPAFSEALLMPRKLYSSHSFLKILYNVPQEACLHDVVAEWQLVTSYAIPVSLSEIISDRFPAVSFTHVYTPFLKVPSGIDAAYQLSVHFMNNQFRVLLKMHGQIHLVQTYSYASPMDVVYYLLKILTEFQLSQEEVHLLLSGFIDENSALYKELYSYFLNIHFVSANTLSLPQQDHPGHFFTSIHNLAACVL